MAKNWQRMTAETWCKLEPALKHLSVSTVEIAKRVLVDGEKPSLIAVELGMTKQAVNSAINRVNKIITPLLENELELVVAMLPPRLAKRIRQLSEKYKARNPNENNSNS